ncbi:amidohydrolase family protein [Agrobacterium tumefaciens]|uniref:amidohydrolase family protein n=1 Tax=Agrobacterium tumefaciens TaxID=358 RepID=UPI001572B43E|nr:amidohydrolase family protein [Agrobacterium tumefaciens]MCZ7497346.1 amidohydrolase family protein [Rhizobium rhizogenes]NTE56560.1 amidohydrolase family protein [Agrobacterium tumefaciens]NTE74528.1 amidohydrolase family protein [Agrobacterium tumefaciens]
MTIAKDGASGQWVDCHVHIFSRSLKLAAARRYQPDYEASPACLIETMTRHNVGKAVLVQPSFLGTDNSYLLGAVAQNSDRFRAVAVIDPDVSAAEIANLAAQGVVGVRLNLIGRRAPDLRSASYRHFGQRLAEFGLFLEIQAENDQWCAIAPALSDIPCAIVIDHFGRTSPSDPSGGLRALMRSVRKEDFWFKFSGPYRFGFDAAKECADIILDGVGIERIVWGSDWPWTQFEGRHSYQDCLRWLSEWVPEDKHLSVLRDNAFRLMKFSEPL